MRNIFFIFILCFILFFQNARADIYEDLGKDFRLDDISVGLARIERFSNITPGKQAEELVAFGKRLKEIDDAFQLFQYEKSADLYQILLNEYPAGHPLRALMLEKQNYYETFQVYKELSQIENREPLEKVVSLTRRLSELHSKRTAFMQKNKLTEEALTAWNLGHNAFQKKQYQEALSYFETAADRLPQHEILKLYLEQTKELVKVAEYFQNAQYRFATPVLKRAVFLLPDEKYLVEWLQQSLGLEKIALEAELAYIDGRYTEAMSGFDRVTKLNPLDQNAKTRLSAIEKILDYKKEGTRYLLEGKYSLALTQFNTALSINGTDLDLKQRIAICYYLVDYQKKNVTDFSAAELKKLKTYQEIKQKVLNYKNFQDKQQKEKELVDGYLKYRQEGYDLFHKKEYKKAITKFDLAVKSNPQDDTSIKWLKLSQSAQDLKEKILEAISKKDRQAAMTYYEQLIQMNAEEKDLLEKIK